MVREAPNPMRVLDAGALAAYLAECRAWVLAELEEMVPREGIERRALYGLMFDYPLREAKALRPALCIAVCRALGGERTAIVRSATVIELYHNAFLIHDDIEDGSLLRRGGPALHRTHGVSVAINVGDAMFALALRPLLDNTAVLGLGKSLRILQAVAHMVQQSVEGQAMELEWIRADAWDLSDEDYIDMVTKKTGWYSFVTPVLLGHIAAGAPPVATAPLAEYARCLGIAFQIQDDLLNLERDSGEYGKEALGDLWEGKRTLILLHMLRTATPPERERARAILRKSRPEPDAREEGPLHALLATLRRGGDITETGLARLEQHFQARAEAKALDEVEWLYERIVDHGSREHARGAARRWALAARDALDRCEPVLPPSIHRDLLATLPHYVLDRVR
jgi:geranylgeranyl diphosphate synthase, type II